MQQKTTDQPTKEQIAFAMLINSIMAIGDILELGESFFQYQCRIAQIMGISKDTLIEIMSEPNVIDGSISIPVE